VQELIKIKENSFCVIRALSGKSTYIRLYFHFLNAEVITCSATLNIFSSCLLNCIASAWSQLILPGRQPGGEAHLQTHKDTEGTFDSNRVTECLHWCTSWKQRADSGSLQTTAVTWICFATSKLRSAFFTLPFPKLFSLGYCRTQRRAYEDVQFFSPAPVGPLCKNWPWAHVSAQYPQTASNRAKLILILI